MMNDETQAFIFRSLLKRVEGWTVPYKKAVRIAGGEKRLELLMREGKIRYDKPAGAMNTHWRINLPDLMQHVKPAFDRL